MKLAFRQGTFLNALKSNPSSLASAMKQTGLTERTLHRWLRSRSFRRMVRRLMVTFAQKRELEVSRGAASAAEMLAGIALAESDAPLPDARRKVMVDLIRLARWRPAKARNTLDCESTEPNEPLLAGPLTDDDIRSLR